MTAVLEATEPQKFLMPEGDFGDPVWYYPHGRKGERAFGWIVKRGEKAVSVSFVHPRGAGHLGYAENVVHSTDPRTNMPNRHDDTWEYRKSTGETKLEYRVAQLEESVKVLVLAASSFANDKEKKK